MQSRKCQEIKLEKMDKIELNLLLATIFKKQDNSIVTPILVCRLSELFSSPSSFIRKTSLALFFWSVLNAPSLKPIHSGIKEICRFKGDYLILNSVEQKDRNWIERVAESLIEEQASKQNYHEESSSLWYIKDLKKYITNSVKISRLLDFAYNGDLGWIPDPLISPIWVKINKFQSNLLREGNVKRDHFRSQDNGIRYSSKERYRTQERNVEQSPLNQRHLGIFERISRDGNFESNKCIPSKSLFYVKRRKTKLQTNPSRFQKEIVSKIETPRSFSGEANSSLLRSSPSRNRRVESRLKPKMNFRLTSGSQKLKLRNQRRGNIQKNLLQLSASPTKYQRIVSNAGDSSSGIGIGRPHSKLKLNNRYKQNFLE